MRILLWQWNLTRGIKDEEEKDKMRAASKVNDQAIARFRELVKEGITEKEIADQTLEIYKELEQRDSPLIRSCLLEPRQPIRITCQMIRY